MPEAGTSDAAAVDAASRDAAARADGAVTLGADSGGGDDAALVTDASNVSNGGALGDGSVSFIGSGGSGPEDAGFDASHIRKQHFEPDPYAPKSGCGCVVASSLPTASSLGASLALVSVVVARRASSRSRRRARS